MSKLRANQLTDKASTGAPTAPNGLVVTGVTTSTTFSGSGASLTSIPAGNLTGTVADARISTLTASKLTGALPAISGANLTGISAGITMADQWRVNSNFNSSSTTHLVNSNWERNDTFFDKIGTGMSESSGVFTFPSTGIYLVMWQHNANGSSHQYIGSYAEISPDNGSSYYPRAENYDSTGGTNYFSSINFQFIVDVTNASLFKVRFRVSSSGSITTEGNTNAQRTGATFIRLGDT